MAETKPKPELKHESDLTTKLPPIKTISCWGTLEELLLACAVNRHGTNSWDSVANELNHRRSTHFTPNICRLKFIDLQRRFSSADAVGNGGDGGGGDDALVWVDELRRLRVAELKRDLHRYDLSIVSLQLKVKRLKEERENSINEERENSDLKKTDDIVSPAPVNGRRNDDSSNESISADNKIKPDGEPASAGPSRGCEPGRGGDSFNGSSNSKESGPREVDPVERVGRVDSGEVGESVAESMRGEEEVVKESSDVQSTASLRRREKKLKGISGNSSGDENQSLASKFSGGGDGGGSGGDKEGGKRKSQALVDFLDLVRKCGSVFERRLETQETPRYKSLIKEHIDLGIIQKRVEEGRYTDCHTMFYRDLMLLVNNAIVFFHKRSSEHKFAVELRQLVTQHFQTHLNIKSCRNLSLTPPAASLNQSMPEVDQACHVDLKPKLAITGPVIACRKRSSIAGKLLSTAPEKKESSPGAVLKKEGEKSSSTSFNAVATKRARDQGSGQRNSTSKNQSSSNRSSRPSPTLKPSPRVSSKGEISEAKTDTKKPSAGNSSSKSKQASRPGKDLLLDVLDSEVKRKIFGNGSSSGNFRNDRHKDHGRGSSNDTNKKSSTEKGKIKEERESPRNKNNGRPPKKATTIVVTGKRGADGRDSDAHAKKRQRR